MRTSHFIEAKNDAMDYANLHHMLHIKHLLSRAVQKAGIGRQVEAAQVVEKFNEIITEMFGKNVLKRARAVYLKDKILTVKCLSSVLVQEIYLKQKKIIDKLNRKFEKEVVSKIKFKM